MNFLGSLKLRTRLMLLMGLSALALIVSNGVGASVLRARMLADRIDKLHATVEMTITVAASLERQVADREITRDQAMAQLRNVMHAMRFDAGDGSISVQRMDDGVMLIHGSSPGREGKPSSVAAPDGKQVLVIDLVRAAMRDGDNSGTISYRFPKPGQPLPRPKVSYFERFPPLNAVFLAGAYIDDLDHDFRSRMTTLVSLGGSILLTTLFAAWLVNRDITRSLGGLRDAMVRLAYGELATEIRGSTRRDEVGDMAAAVLVFKEGMAEAERLRTAREAAKALAAAEQRAALHRMADGFEGKVGHLVGILSSASTELEATAQSMTHTADRSNQQANTVASAAEEATAGLQTVASAAEELTASIGEISGQVARSSKITDKAVEDAKHTDGIVRALAEGAEKIGAVVGLITNIASQTNLLALNATRRRAPVRRVAASPWWRPRSRASPTRPARRPRRSERRWRRSRPRPTKPSKPFGVSPPPSRKSARSRR
jgi:methyl-accepting chemotaxis protein